MSVALHFIHFGLLLTKEFHIAVASSYFTDAYGEDRCSASTELIRSSEGVIVTPGFWQSQKYPPNCQRSWTFLVDKEKFIQFRFLDFHLEQYNNCLKDRLDIISVASSEPVVLKRFCGSRIPGNITVPANLSVRLEFWSDDIYEFPGFRIEYSVQNNDAGCDSGFFKCKNTKCVLRDKICDKTDDCRDGTDEENCGYQLESQNKCGLPTIQPVIGGLLDRIVGGSESIPGSWPWQISIHKANTFPSGHYCGGSILDHNWIITAGHCVHDQTVNSIRIHLGSHKEFEDDEGEIIRYPKQIIIHPKFTARNLKNDIALVQLNAPVTFSETISNICLPDGDFRVADGMRCVVTGWGSTYGSGHAGVLKQALVPVISTEECGVLTKKKLSESVMCTGFKGQTPCHGDSGGPLVCTDTHLKWFLAGIVSTGPKLCGMKHEPSIFTKTEFYLNWIKNASANETRKM